MLKSILRPDTSVLVGLANGAMIITVYQHALPNAASIRTADPHDGDVEIARRHAAWTSAGILGFVYLLTRDRNAFLMGGLVLAGVDIMVKHANGIDPMTGKLHSHYDETIGHMTGSGELDNVYPMPEYADEANM